MNQPRLLLSAGPEAPERYRIAFTHAGAAVQGGYCPDPDLSCDGLVLCGGGDADPALFGQENCGSNPPDPARDAAELALFRAFLQAGKPILGICRGMQMINIALGGTLIQDLPQPLRLFHRGLGRDVYQYHPIRTAQGSILHTLYGDVMTVNSYHHQAVDRLGSGLEAIAWAEGGFPEALCHRELPILGVQFHPERLSCDLYRPEAADGIPLLTHFLSLCRGS